MSIARFTLLTFAVGLFALPQFSVAQHLETGSAAFTKSGSDATDPPGWVPLSFEQSFSQIPVVIIGPLRHGPRAEQDAAWSMSLRIRNISLSGFEIAPSRPEGSVDAFVSAATDVHRGDGGAEVVLAHPSSGPVVEESLGWATRRSRGWTLR